MTTTKDLLLISHLRKNARATMTTISKNTKIPISTIFDKLKEYDQGLITKHTCLLNFKNIGYNVRAHVLFKVDKETRPEFLRYLQTHQSTNNVFRINNEYDYLVEAIFASMQELNSFCEEAEEKGAKEHKEYYIVEDVKREAFLTHQPGFEKLLPRKLAEIR